MTQNKKSNYSLK